MYGCFVHMYVCVPCVSPNQRGQQRAWDPLELDLQMAVSQRVVAES